MKSEELSREQITLVAAIRKSILSTSKEIAEMVKWNSPCFYFNGDMKQFDPKEYKRDLVVLNIRPERILLVFPTGSIIANEDAVLEGQYADGRRMITIKSLDEYKKKELFIQHAILDWLKKIDR